MVAAFFEPSLAGVVPGPVVNGSGPRRLRDAIEPIAMHSVWSRVTNERLAGLGLDFLSSYVWGRAAALGEPDPGVVVAAFAVFEPSMIVATYEQGRAACPRDQLLAARAEATIGSLRSALSDAEVTAVADELAAAVSAADGTGPSAVLRPRPPAVARRAGRTALAGVRVGPRAPRRQPRRGLRRRRIRTRSP